MNCRYKKQFLKDLARIPARIRAKTEQLVFDTMPSETNEQIFQRIAKMKGYDGYYKIRIGEYRIGLFLKENILEFRRILNRKDIYRFFP